MKVIAVIPARYASSRFPGKPLADILGKPMIWWVYNQISKAKGLSEIIIATDDVRIEKICQKYNMKVMMTKSNHATSTERVYEVAQNVPADLYVVVNGDEPLLDPKVIETIIPTEDENLPKFYVSNIMSEINNSPEVLDFTNIKVVVDSDYYAMYFSRSPIPYPKASLNYKYFKHVGVLIYSFSALEFFSKTSKGKIERIEDVNEIRFIENGQKIKMVSYNTDSLSVDTPKDLEKVIEILEKEIR